MEATASRWYGMLPLLFRVLRKAFLETICSPFLVLFGLEDGLPPYQGLGF